MPHDLLSSALFYANHGPFAFLVWLVAFAIAMFMVVGTVLSVGAFIIVILVNTWRLYTEPATADLSKYHAYTQGILQNRCHEIEKVKKLRAKPQTKEVKQEIFLIVQSMIDTLEIYEKEPIKHDLIKQIKGI